jgi:hypothetical protein
MPVQQIKPVALEIAFEGHYPVERNAVEKSLNTINKKVQVEFTGNGFVLQGWARKPPKSIRNRWLKLL